MSNVLKSISLDGFNKKVVEYLAGENITFTPDASDATKITISADGADLTNYYTKSEVDDLISAIDEFNVVVANSLPQQGEERTIYLIPKNHPGESGNVRNEYMWINNAWELIGDTAVDLTNYYTKTETDTLLDAKQDTLTAGTNIQIAQDGTISATDTTYDPATQSTAGLMSAADKAKLDGIADGATANEGTITGISSTSPITGSGTSGNVNIGHADSGVAAGSKGDTSNQTPAFGGTFKVPSGTVNAKGHLTAFNEHTVKVPDNVATPSSKGLMSASDKEKLLDTYTKPEVNAFLAAKQDTLVSGTNIKTVGGVSLLGNGDIPVNTSLRNLVDGSATGSVRGVGTDEEGSGYSLGMYAFAEGHGTRASGDDSHAEGVGTTASGDFSHAEGDSTTASGVQSHAEGAETRASGDASHAEGISTTASGIASHAEGGGTASGDFSHAGGYNTVAASDYQTAIGKYNVEDSSDTYAFIIGKGTNDSNRSNALAVDWNGNIDMAGAVSETLTENTSPAGTSFFRMITAGAAHVKTTLNTIANWITRSYVPSTSNPTAGSIQAQLNSLNSNFTIEALSSCASLSDVSSALVAKLDAMKSNSVAQIRLPITGSFAPFTSGVTYLGEIRKSGTTTYSSVILYGLGAAEIIFGYKNASGWTFKNVTLS